MTCSDSKIQQNRFHNRESGGRVTVHLMRKCTPSLG